MVLTGAWFFWRGHVLTVAMGIDAVTTFKSVLNNSPAFISYFGKMLLPVNLTVLPVLEDTTLIYGMISLILTGVLILASKNKRWNYILFALGWIVLFLLPSMVISFLFHEYRVYIPLAAVFILLYEIDFVKNLGKDPQAALGVVLVIGVLFFYKTFSYAENSKDRLAYWRSAVAGSPHSPLAQRNLGAMYYMGGNIIGAEKLYKKALELNPTEPMVHNNLGLIYAGWGELQKAEAEYLKEIVVNPNYDKVHYNLGFLYLHENRVDEAMAMFEKTIQINPKYLQAYEPLLTNYLKQGNQQKVDFYLKQLKSMGIMVMVNGKEAM